MHAFQAEAILLPGAGAAFIKKCSAASNQNAIAGLHGIVRAPRRGL